MGLICKSKKLALVLYYVIVKQRNENEPKLMKNMRLTAVFCVIDCNITWLFILAIDARSFMWREVELLWS